MAFQKVYELHGGIFHPINLCHNLSILLITSPVLFTKNKKLKNERKEDFLHIWLLQHITLYQRRYKITSLATIEFVDTQVCVNNPHWQSSGIIIFLCKYCIVISGKLIGSFLDVFSLLLAVILSELQEKPKRKYWVTEKST